MKKRMREREEDAMKIQDNIGARVRDIREDLGMTSTELARKVGISQAQISRLEGGKQGWRSHTLQKVAKALGVTAGFLYSDKDSLGAMVSMIQQHPELRKVLKSSTFVDLVIGLSEIKSRNPKAFRAVTTIVEQLG